MRSLLRGFTTRGRSFLAAGLAAALCGIALGEPDLVRVGALVFLLPLLSALAAGRARYRLGCLRQLTPSRVSAGQPVVVSVKIDNVARLPTGLLLAEDTVPYSLGSPARFVLEPIERAGSREIHYQIRSDVRGKFTVGPLQLRVADPFGLVELGRAFSTKSTLVVSPKVVPLPSSVIPGSWLGDGEGRTRSVAAAGEDDIAPRPYRDGDELRRVHWRSTARYGELMVRREEQQWRNHVTLLLDTRRSAHVGSGAVSSFEAAVSAAASIGVHLAMQGFEGRLITDAGPVGGAGAFEDVLLDSLAVVTPTSGHGLAPGLASVKAGGSGLFIVVAGKLGPAEAKTLAHSHRGNSPALALLLDVPTWAPSGAGSNHDTQAAAGVLAEAGWRVVTLPASGSLPAAWQRLHQTPAVRQGDGVRYQREGAR